MKICVECKWHLGGTTDRLDIRTGHLCMSDAVSPDICLVTGKRECHSCSFARSSTLCGKDGKHYEPLEK